MFIHEYGSKDDPCLYAGGGACDTTGLPALWLYGSPSEGVCRRDRNLPREAADCFGLGQHMFMISSLMSLTGGHKYTLTWRGSAATENIKRKEDRGMIKTTMKIDGMMCGMCEAHICDAIRKAIPEAKKVTASKNKKEAFFLTEEAVDTDHLKAAIDATGYTCQGIESAPYEKKGLFGWR